jgi:DNA recombination protein RmuC
LAALLNALQMGFRTLAIERHSSEVWDVLHGVKREFGRFGEALSKVRRKIREAGDQIDSAQRRSQKMERELRAVEGPAAAGRLSEEND